MMMMIDNDDDVYIAGRRCQISLSLFLIIIRNNIMKMDGLKSIIQFW